MPSKPFEKAVEKLESYMVMLMGQARIPGGSIAIVKNSKVMYARGFGARNREENLPATPDTLYGIGSSTKSFTAMAIMQLVEQGKLDVQDPVIKYVPFKLGGRKNPIRIFNLLTHSSGIPDVGATTMVFRIMDGKDDPYIPMGNINDALLHINGAEGEIADEPGRRFFYLNDGYMLLGEVIERVSKMKYEDYIKKKILKPLKMNRSTFSKESLQQDADVMTGYRSAKGTMTPSKFPFHEFIYPAGGLLSSVTELSNYLAANINGGLFGDTHVLDAALLEEMHKPYVESNIPGMLGKTKYGFGWMITEDFFGHKLVEHGGNIGVSSASLGFVPDQKMGVAVAFNADVIFGSLLTQSVLALLMGKDPEKEFPFFGIQKKLKMLAGVYQTYKGIGKVSVVNKGGLLYAETKEGDMEMSMPLIPESDEPANLRFYIMTGPGLKMLVEFVVDPSGKIDAYIERLRLHKIGGAQ